MTFRMKSWPRPNRKKQDSANKNVNEPEKPRTIPEQLIVMFLPTNRFMRGVVLVILGLAMFIGYLWSAIPDKKKDALLDYAAKLSHEDKTAPSYKSPDSNSVPTVVTALVSPALQTAPAINISGSSTESARANAFFSKANQLYMDKCADPFNALPDLGSALRADPDFEPARKLFTQVLNERMAMHNHSDNDEDRGNRPENCGAKPVDGFDPSEVSETPAGRAMADLNWGAALLRWYNKPLEAETSLSQSIESCGNSPSCAYLTISAKSFRAAAFYRLGKFEAADRDASDVIHEGERLGFAESHGKSSFISACIYKLRAWARRDGALALDGASQDLSFAKTLGCNREPDGLTKGP